MRILTTLLLFVICLQVLIARVIPSRVRDSIIRSRRFLFSWWFYLLHQTSVLGQFADTFFQDTGLVLTSVKMIEWHYSLFFAIKNTSELSLFWCQFLWIFALYLKLIVCFKVFLIGKFEKIQEFNRDRALILSPSNSFLTKVCLWYRACLQRPTYGISIFLVRCIHGPGAFLICHMFVYMAFLIRSCYGFYLCQGWDPGLRLSNLSLAGKAGKL